jgi:hypothetical protein
MRLIRSVGRDQGLFAVARARHNDRRVLAWVCDDCEIPRRLGARDDNIICRQRVAGMI